MQDASDLALVREYAERNSGSAFAELFRRHGNLVYSVALRLTGNSEDAQDVTQAVFIILVQKAASLRGGTILTGWLYETTRFTAMKQLRTKARQQAREQEAYMKSTLNDANAGGVWKQLAPLLEDAMARLNEKERTLLALRFFENKSGAETAAILGIREWAAHKRMNRAVKKLRGFFAKRGIVLSAEALATAVSANSVQPGPATLTKTVIAVAMSKGAAASGSTLTLVKGALKLMASAKVKSIVVTGAVVLLAAGIAAATATTLLRPRDSAPSSPPPAAKPVAGREWQNSLGMKFVPAGTDGVLFGVWDVRVQDFQAYAQATGYQQTGGMWVTDLKTDASGRCFLMGVFDYAANWKHPGFEQEPICPVVGVTWDEAEAFCRWLTDKERKEGILGPNQAYRLPTDAEWSKAAGDGKYPWGDTYPPPPGAGNYADEALASSPPGESWSRIPYHLAINDGYPRTSPVGSFRPNAYGLYDMGGNVWQWCEDWYRASMAGDEQRKNALALDDGGGSKYKVMRGGSWEIADPDGALSSCRNFNAPDYRVDSYGFRVVVVVSP